MERSTPVIVTLAFAAIAILVACLMTGCTLHVDKSTHMVAFIDAGELSRVIVRTDAENTSDTTADGNTASAEADLSIPLLP